MLLLSTYMFYLEYPGISILGTERPIKALQDYSWINPPAKEDKPRRNSSDTHSTEILTSSRTSDNFLDIILARAIFENAFVSTTTQPKN